MRRLDVWFVFAPVVIAGCSTRMPTAAPVDVAARLHRYETRSIATREPGPMPATGLRYALRSRPDIEAASIGGIASSNASTWSEEGLSWTLAVFDEPKPQSQPADSGEFRLALKQTSGYERRGPRDTLWATIKQDVKHMHTDLWRDTKRVYAEPVNLAILGVALGGSIAVRGAGPDDSVEDHFRPGHHHMDDSWRNAFDAVGNPGTHFALAGLWYLIGQQTGDEKTYEVGKTMASALIINGLTVLAGQAASADRAPNGEYGTFPSGHTSSSFVMASVLHRAYGHAVGIPLYAIAVCVGAERVDDRNHYFSDVVMGGVLGTVIGHAVASGRDPEFFGWKVLPYANPNGGAGIAITKSFP